MNKLFKKVFETEDVVEYRYDICDEDIIQNRHKVDLGEDGEFIAKHVVLEFSKEDGEMFPSIEIFGIYKPPKIGLAIKNAILTVDLNLKESIKLKDIEKSKWTAGEIIALPWEHWAVNY